MTQTFMTRTFIEPFRERVLKLFSSSQGVRFIDGSIGEPASSTLHGERDDKLLAYERYHWGFGPGPWY